MFQGDRTMRFFATLLFFALMAVPAHNSADERFPVSLGKYKKMRRVATSREAYQRALQRLSGVRAGMRSDLFFEKMKMMILKNKRGKVVDGFVEGHLKRESLEMTKGKDPDHYLVFGYYQNWKRRRGPVRKFYVVFRDMILQEITFFDPGEDIFSEAASSPVYRDMK